MDIHIPYLTRVRFLHTVGWAVLLSALVVGIAATLARATLNLTAAMTEKPDLAVYLLLPDQGVTQSTLLREKDNQRDYLIDTKTGPKLLQLKKGAREWYVANEEDLHESGASSSSL